MKYVKNFFKHLHTINRHRRLVRHYCFRIGLYWQGLTHDLSKYSPTEFWAGVKYYQGVRSPNVAERLDRGMSLAWIHHKGRNRHHYEYWTDYSNETGNNYEPMEMPLRYLCESLVDRISACRVYKGKDYTDSSAYEYFKRREETKFMHPNTYRDLEKLLKMLSEEGEEATLKYVRELLKNDKKNKLS